MIGSNIKKLWAIKMAGDAIPDGGNFMDGVKFLSSKESLVSGARVASEWVQNAIKLIREAAEPNPWKDSTDEEIAGELLNRIDERRKKQTIDT